MVQEDKDQEIWVAIKGYEEYSVSNRGRVKRHAYYKNVCGGGKQFQKERILKPQKAKLGYLIVGLSNSCFQANRNIKNSYC